MTGSPFGLLLRTAFPASGALAADEGLLGRPPGRFRTFLTDSLGRSAEGWPRMTTLRCRAALAGSTSLTGLDAVGGAVMMVLLRTFGGRTTPGASDFVEDRRTADSSVLAVAASALGTALGLEVRLATLGGRVAALSCLSTGEPEGLGPAFALSSRHKPAKIAAVACRT